MKKPAVAGLGSKIRVLVVHLHTHVAKNEKGFREQQKEVPVWLSELLEELNCDILMGDFNMWLWKVVPELRQKGVVINLLAWFPWKSTKNGYPMCDSCGIFLCNHAPHSVQLANGMDTLNNGPTGFFKGSVLKDTAT